VFKVKTYIHTLVFMQCIGLHYPYRWFTRLCQQFSSLVVIHRVFFMYHLHLVHAKYAQGRWFMNMFLIQYPPNLEAPALFLMLIYERCLNALLSVGLYPLTSAHLF
jgi:hypothetical protein